MSKRRNKSSQTKRIVVESNIIMNDNHLLEVVTKSIGRLNTEIEDMIIRKCGKKIDEILNKPEFEEWIKSEAVTAALISRVYNLDEETENERIKRCVYKYLSNLSA